MKNITNLNQRNIRYIILFLSVVYIALWLCAGVSFANSPARASCIAISLRNVPEEAKYLDVLIPMSRDDPYYSSFNEELGRQTGLGRTASIVSYSDEDQYVSYSFHMVDAVSQMELEEMPDDGYEILQFESGAYAGGLSHLEYIQKNFGTIKAALLDEEGNVLSVSDAATIAPGRSGYLASSIVYDCAQDTLTAYIHKTNVVGTVLLIGLVLLMQLVVLGVRAVFTAVVETAVSLAFRIRPWSTVLIVNLISNLIFNLMLRLFTIFTPVPYLVLVTVGEILVIAVEYSVYRRRLTSYSRVRLLAFTVTANLCSCLLGLVL